MTLSVTPIRAPQMNPAAVVFGADMNMLVAYLNAQNQALLGALTNPIAHPAANINIPIDDTDAVSNIVTDVLPMPVMLTETPWQIPIGVKRFMFQTRGGEVLYISHKTGRVSTPTDQYWTMKKDGLLADNWIRVTGPKTLYFASPSNSVVIEFILES